MSSRTRRLIFAGFLLGAAPLLAACAPQATSPHHRTAASAQDLHTITVVGRGEVSAKPDIARANLGVEVLAPTLAEATQSAASRMSTLLAALQKAGIAQKDIQTSNFSVNLERQPEPPPMPMPMPMPVPARPGTPPPPPAAPAAPRDMYRVSNTVTVAIRDLARVGPVLDAAIAAGANSLWGVSFGLDKTDALEAQAREKAVADARARAEALAKLGGVPLGELVTLSEIVESGPPFPMPMAAKMAEYSGGTPVAPGEVTLATQVKVVYAIAPR